MIKRGDLKYLELGHCESINSASKTTLLEMISLLISTAAALLVKRTSMDCGNAPYCGVLVLERDHAQPAVHGLWPEDGSYGNSQCVSPGGDPNANLPTVSCYNDYSFQLHEWQAHGVCAANDPATFFNTVCKLSAAPLKLMAQLKAKGQNLASIANGLVSAGYPVYNRNAGNDQLELSVCAGSDGVWRLASTSKFSSACGF
ncbi:hypothetical protein HDV06_001298 [Boothiomyces sp. JEL0866]|nr:hypothetical protein HDV06_001298 [Boothiomyces sp. JEL0866]